MSVLAVWHLSGVFCPRVLWHACVHLLVTFADMDINLDVDRDKICFYRHFLMGSPVETMTFKLIWGAGVLPSYNGDEASSNMALKNQCKLWTIDC